MNTINNQRAEWLKERANGIGASEVASLLGLNPYTTAYQAVNSKIEARKGNIIESDNDATICGHYLEDGVARLTADKYGWQIDEVSKDDFIVKNKRYEWLQCSPDRYINDGKHNVLLEIKTTNLPLNNEEDIECTDIATGAAFQLPIYYYLQVVYQLEVCESDYGYISLLQLGKRTLFTAKIQRNEELFSKIAPELDAIWQMIKAEQLPEPTTAEDCQIAFPRSVDGKTTEASAIIYDDYLKLKELTTQQKELEEQINELKDTLKVAIEDAEVLTYNGERLATFKNRKASQKFNTKRFQLEHPDIYKEYLEEVEGIRIFLLK